MQVAVVIARMSCNDTPSGEPLVAVSMVGRLSGAPSVVLIVGRTVILFADSSRPSGTQNRLPFKNSDAPFSCQI